MNRLTRRSAFTLMEIVGLLPIIAAITTMAYLTITRVERMQSMENAARQDDAVIDDLVRRIQEDAGRAGEARVTSADAGSELTLRDSRGTIIYSASPTGLARSERSNDNPPVRYEWSTQHTRIDFKIEAISNRPRIVWIVFTQQNPAEEGPDRVHSLAAAAVIGAGGAR